MLLPVAVGQAPWSRCWDAQPVPGKGSSAEEMDFRHSLHIWAAKGLCLEWGETSPGFVLCTCVCAAGFFSRTGTSERNPLCMQ